MDLTPPPGIYTNLMEYVLSWKILVKTGLDSRSLESEESCLYDRSKKVAGLIHGYLLHVSAWVLI